MAEKTAGQLLAEKLLMKKEHIMDVRPEIKDDAWAFCEPYKAFLDAGKTEREVVDASVELLKAAGYKPYDSKTVYAPGDKVYKINRGHALIAATIGQKPLVEGLRITAAHIDSPRLDLKPTPMYESGELAYFKTAYYGGVRKYQWGVTPLALHGVVVKKGGEVVKINIGEDAGDPLMYISDLLPHLGRAQNQRTLADGLKAEELNIILGSLPYADEEVKSDKFKLTVLAILNEKYGITEADFARAELEIVPAFKAQDVGLDRSMIGAYGHDDRVCAYPALMAELNTATPPYTTVCVLADKEEVGSDGVTGLASDAMTQFLEYLCQSQGADYKDVFANALCLSADVTAAFDPTFPDVYDPYTAAYLNHGPSIAKYTGGGGKGGASDAVAELVSHVEDIFDDAGVVWQINQMGKTDAGGGGTVARCVARHNIDVLDVGVPMLSMHSPYELVAKLDVYMTYLAFKAFNEQ